jgi:hypothetical protein
LYLKKTAGKILGYCHHCGSSAVVSIKGKGSYKSIKMLLEMDKEVKAEKGKRTLPMDAKHVFDQQVLSPWSNWDQKYWFNNLGTGGKDGVPHTQAVNMILVYLYRCGLLMPGSLSLPPLNSMWVCHEPEYVKILDKVTRFHTAEHSSMRFMTHNPLFKRFWEELKYSASQCRLFIPYWNNTITAHTTGGHNQSPSGYMGRDILINPEPGDRRIKWLKYPLDNGKAANAYVWHNSSRSSVSTAPLRWLQIYVEDLISQLRIMQALCRSFPTREALATPQASLSATPGGTEVELNQYEILRQLDGIRVICCQGTSLNDDVKEAATIKMHFPHGRDELRFGAPWMDLDTAGRKAALQLVMLPVPGQCGSSLVIVQDEPKNGTDEAIIAAVADTLPSKKGWV